MNEYYKNDCIFYGSSSIVVKNLLTVPTHKIGAATSAVGVRLSRSDFGGDTMHCTDLTSGLLCIPVVPIRASDTFS